MMIFIPTHGRVHAQHTLKFVPEATLVVSEEEAEAHVKLGRKILICPHQGKGTLSDVLEWVIWENDFDKVLFLDDDLKFCYRKTPGDWKLAYSEPNDGTVCNLLVRIRLELAEYPMVGVASRQGFNRLPENKVEATRQMQVHGFDVSYLKKHGIHHNRVPIKQDFDVLLQVLRSGRPNCVLTDWAVDSVGGSGASGGCSRYRNRAMLDDIAHKLAELHPGLVKVVEKETKGAWGGGKRVDVICYWKKALQQGEANVE